MRSAILVWTADPLCTLHHIQIIEIVRNIFAKDHESGKVFRIHCCTWLLKETERSKKETGDSRQLQQKLIQSKMIDICN